MTTARPVPDDDRQMEAGPVSTLGGAQQPPVVDGAPVAAWDAGARHMVDWPASIDHGKIVVVADPVLVTRPDGTRRTIRRDWLRPV